LKYRNVVTYVNEIIGQYGISLTLRQIFYRLVANYDYPNTKSMYTQLSRHLVKARKLGDVDESRIEDRSREFIGGDDGFENPDDFISHRINHFLASPKYYQRRMWSSQPEFIIIWIEKDALSRVVSMMADKFNVITAPSKGYASYTYIKSAIERLPKGKEITVLHFADHDPSGIDMTRDLKDRLNAYSNLNIAVQRIALTYDQVREYKLSPNPAKSADPRAIQYSSNFGNECWELDAIEPSELQRLVYEAISNHVDLPTWKKIFEQEKYEKQKLEALFSSIAKLLKEHKYM